MIFLKKQDWFLVFSVILLVTLGLLVLNSIADYLFPEYYLFILLGFVFFFIFSRLDFEVITAFSWYFYFFSILLLVLTLLLGRVTRGAVRWIPLGNLTIQPAEIVRPFLIIFLAGFLTSGKLNARRLFEALVLFSLPAFLILIQPSLGVFILTLVSFLGVILALPINRKKLFLTLIILALLVPFSYHFLAPYQKQRIGTFLNPVADPLGAGYNSIQSVIAVGSGGLWGKGLGKGIQTQLAFLPERHSDFIFAAVSEEMGFVGGFLILAAYLVIFLRLIRLISKVKNPATAAFLTGLFLTLLAQVFINIGMNLGILPITGVPLPLVSSGGSSFLSMMISLGIVNNISSLAELNRI